KALHITALLLWQPNLEAVTQQHHHQRTNKHTPDNPAIRAGPGGTVQLDHLVILPPGHIHPEHLQEHAPKPGKFTGDRPDRGGQAEVQCAEQACDDEHNIGVPVALEDGLKHEAEVLLVLGLMGEHSTRMRPISYSATRATLARTEMISHQNSFHGL